MIAASCRKLARTCQSEGTWMLRHLSFGQPVRFPDEPKDPRPLKDFPDKGPQLSAQLVDFPDMGPPIPEYEARTGEDTKTMRSRLIYQSRKRGMTENCLVFSHFASKYLHTFDRAQLQEYDFLINKPSNDWDLYYWMTDKADTPPEYDLPMMDMLKEFVKNEDMEIRLKQPGLTYREEPDE